MAIGYTPYSLQQQAFSDKGHALAQTEIYPVLFNTQRSNLEFTVLPEDEAKRRDCDEAIDRTIEVRVKGLLAPFTFTSQERFRRPEVAFSDDVTMTEWNYNSDFPGELYKIKADFFLYGKYDEQSNRFTEAIVFDVCRTLLYMAQGHLPFERKRNKKNQGFICIPTASLQRYNLVFFHKFWR